ncbi:unnamed protein product [Absidia cylindrospora]
MARKQFDFTLRGKMPDLTVSLKEEHATYDITVMEVKPANVTNKDADLLKLGNMLKDSMDKLHKHGLTSDGVRVFGVLVEGYQCDLYVMDLDYTFVYLFYKFGTFYIPCNRYDFARLVDVVEHMLLWVFLMLLPVDANEIGYFQWYLSIHWSVSATELDTPLLTFRMKRNEATQPMELN